MRKRIASELGIELYDVYGLTEVYGPGIAISCDHNNGMHYWDDYIYIEIVDPKTGEPVPDGEIGEIVITTLKKQGAPLIRYRTHDLSRKIVGQCACGSHFPRIDTILGRTDDMVKVKGVNVFPSQIEELLKRTDGASSEYRVVVDHVNGKDVMTVFVETEKDADKGEVEKKMKAEFKSRIGMTPNIKPVDLGELPRSEKKSTRVIDNRYA